MDSECRVEVCKIGMRVERDDLARSFAASGRTAKHTNADFL